MAGQGFEAPVVDIQHGASDMSPVPLIAVDGASRLVPERPGWISEVLRVPHHAVAEAVGAATAQVSGNVLRTRVRVVGDIARRGEEAGVS